MTSLPASTEAVRPRRAPRYYVFRLRYGPLGGEPLLDIVAGPMTDLIVAWRAAGEWRRFYDSSADLCGGGHPFIAGDMDATMT